MVNFVQKTQNFGATRIYTAPITSMETFQNAITGILGAATLGTTERGSESYSIPIEIYDATGEPAATVNIRAETQAIYEAAITAATASAFAAAIAGADAEAATLSSKSNWSVRISCKLNSDSYAITVKRDEAVISNYSDPATLSAVEAYFDTVDIFN